MAALVACIMLVGCRAATIQASDVGPVLHDLSGTSHQPLNEQSCAVTVFIFITNDCPIANGYAPEINSMVRDYSKRGAGFYLVHVDRDVSAAQAEKHAQEYGFKCPVLLDPQHELVRAVGATVTPEAAVILNQAENGKDRLAYRGRIDDRYVDLGKRRLQPSRRDLRESIDAALRGEAPPNPRTKAIGCFIPEREE